MNSNLWPFIFLLLSAQVTIQQSTVYVPTADDDGYSSHGELLEHYLCDDTVSSTLSNTALLLSTAGTHTLHQSCVIKGISGLVIASNNSNGTIINCDASLGGIVFYNVTELAISRIHIVNCSAPLPTDIAMYDNMSTFYFGPGQRSTFYFSNCENISIESMLFESISGFSLLVANSFSEIYVNNIAIIESNDAESCKKNTSFVCAGSGIVFYYHNHMMGHISKAASVVICNCNFTSNNNVFFPNFKYSRLCYTQDFDNHDRHPLLTAAGLSFLFTQNSSNVSVSIKTGHFLHNNPLVILAIFSNVPGLASIVFQQINMTENVGFNPSYSSAVRIAIDYRQYTAAKNTFMQDGPLMFNNFSLIHHKGVVPAIYITGSSNSTVITDLIFEHFYCERLHIKIKSKGVCIIAESIFLSKANAPVGKLHFYFISAKVSNNRGGNVDILSKFTSFYYSHAAFLFTNIDHVVIEGSEADPSMFSNNNVTAVATYSSNLVLKGNIVFTSNHGVQGGALSLYDSYLILTEGVDVTFTSNTANVDGGAIYAYNDPSGYYDTPCVIQFKTNTTDLAENFKITVQNNIILDKRGLNVSISPAYECSQTFSPVMKNDLRDIYNNIAPSQPVIRSTPAKVGLCTYTDNSHYILSFGTHVAPRYYTYSGVPFKLSVAAVDLGGNIVPGEIYAKATPNDDHIAMHLNELDTYKSFAHTDKCANFTYRIYLKQKDGTYNAGKLLLYLRNTEDLLILSFQMKQCPLGYALSSDGACQCNNFIKALSKAMNFKFQCWIDLKPHNTDCGYNSSNCIANISITDYGWIGLYNNTNIVLAFTHNCPLGNCKIYQHSADLF